MILAEFGEGSNRLQSFLPDNDGTGKQLLEFRIIVYTIINWPSDADEIRVGY